MQQSNLPISSSNTTRSTAIHHPLSTTNDATTTTPFGGGSSNNNDHNDDRNMVMNHTVKPPREGELPSPPISYPLPSPSSSTTRTPIRQQQQQHHHLGITTNTNYNINNTFSNSSTTGSSSRLSSVSTTNTTSTIPSTTVASVIQSAARVSLYNNNNNSSSNNNTSSSSNGNTTNTPNPNRRDTNKNNSNSNSNINYDDFVHSLFVSSASSHNNDVPTANLLSLPQKEMLPILPSEQDRKRFIGCIAAIIVAMYQYEQPPPPPPSPSQQQSQSQQQQPSNNTSTTTSSKNSTDNRAGTSASSTSMDGSEHTNTSWSQRFYDDDDNNNNNKRNDPNSNDEEDEDDDDFDYFEDVDAQTNKLMMDHHNDDSSFSTMGQKRPPSLSSSLSSLQRQQQQQGATTKASNNSNSSSTGTGTLFRNNRNHMATIRAHERYRKRRFDIYGQFIITATEQLQLDSGHGKCFLPILEQLLNDPNEVVQHKNHNNNYNNDGPTKQKSKQAQRRTTSNATTSNHPKFNSSFYNVDYLHYQMNEISNLRPFLEGMSHGAGIRCIAMLLVQQLLHSNTTTSSSSSTNGYDARIRHVLKSVGVLVLLHDRRMEQIQDQQLAQEQRRHSMELLSSLTASSHRMSTNSTDVLFIDETDDDDRYYDHSGSSGGGTEPLLLGQKTGIDNNNNNNTINSSPQLVNHSRQEIYPADLVTVATRQFESLEQYLARKLIEISEAQQQQSTSTKSSKTGSLSSRDMGGGGGSSTREKIFRGLKIGGTAVAAGTLFAITGGLAAPGIAAGIAAVVGTTGFATAAITLTTHAAVMSIFGVGGGSLVAYKMKRRTVGLTEFEFCKESPMSDQSTTSTEKRKKSAPDAELFYTVCISGWLRDDCDFQRPWGLSPTRPSIEDRLELLERFYSVHRPGHVPRCAKILESWKNEEQQLWKLLRQTYHRDPDHLYPLLDGPRFRGSLTLEQREAVEKILEELGCTAPKSASSGTGSKVVPSPMDQMLFPGTNDPTRSNSFNSSIFRDDSSQHGFDDIAPVGDEAEVAEVAHLATVWDYHATYGGELYTVRWESDLIEELCMSVFDLAADVVTGATSHLLKFTVLSALAAALAIPVALKNAANMIDGTWTLVVERSDLAGKELAQSLLFSTAGNRPVNLVGFSFGARVIYACLKELARYQEKWEDYQDRLAEIKTSRHKRDMSSRDENDDYMRKMREPASIVGDVILMGLPNHMSHASWQACRQVVAGRLVNCYSRKDLILSLMFQYKKFGFKSVCGTCPVDVAGIENFDVSDLVSGHQDYCLITGDILKRVRLDQPFRHDHVNQVEYFESSETSVE